MQAVPQNLTKAQLHSSQVSLWNNIYIFEVCFHNTCFLTLGSRFETEADNNPPEPDSTHFHFTLSSPCVSSCLPASVTLLLLQSQSLSVIPLRGTRPEATQV